MSSCPDCFFEIHQLWQSGFSRLYSNCCCSCSFEAEILKIDQSFHEMYSNKILNFQVSTTIFNTCTKKKKKNLETYWIHHVNYSCTLPSIIQYTPWRCPWCNCYRRRKWTRRYEFKSWTRLIAFHIALIPLGKVWIQIFSLQLWVNSGTDYFLQPWSGN